MALNVRFSNVKTQRRIKRGPENGVSILKGHKQVEGVVYHGMELGLTFVCIYETLILSLVFRHDSSVCSLSKLVVQMLTPG